jgi:hypothetical protein
MRIAEVSTSDRMEAEVYVLEADAGGLAAGKEAELVIESQPDLPLKAKVISVEPFPKPLHRCAYSVLHSRLSFEARRRA